MITLEDQPLFSRIFLQMKDSYLFYHKHTHLTSHSTFTVQLHIKHSRRLCRNASQMIFSSLPSLPFHLFYMPGKWKQRLGTRWLNCSSFAASSRVNTEAGECKLNSAAGRHGAARNGDVGFRWDTAQSYARSCPIFLPFKPRHTSSEQCLTGTGSQEKKKKKRKNPSVGIVIFSFFLPFCLFHSSQSVNTSPHLWSVGDVLTPLWIILLVLFLFFSPRVIVWVKI